MDCGHILTLFTSLCNLSATFPNPNGSISGCLDVVGGKVISLSLYPWCFPMVLWHLHNGTDFWGLYDRLYKLYVNQCKDDLNKYLYSFVFSRPASICLYHWKITASKTHTHTHTQYLCIYLLHFLILSAHAMVKVRSQFNNNLPASQVPVGNKGCTFLTWFPVRWMQYNKC